jgi:hypothetical protein
VIEAPPMLQALLDDFWHRPLVGPELNGVQYLGDIGLPGPDKGKGGKYLIIPEGHKGRVDAKQYYVYKSPTNGVLVFLRSFFKSIDDLSPGVKAVEGIKIYPLEGARQEMKFVQASDLPANALFAHDASYFEMLNRFIQSEAVDRVDPYMHGVLASLGIRKGAPFTPNEEQKKLLGQAAQTAWKMAKNIAADYDKESNALWWSDRKWVAHAKTELDDFMHTLLDEQYRSRKTGHTDVAAKAHMFINHYSISPGMMSSIPGLGAKYAAAYKDSQGNLLRGENTYQIDLPKKPTRQALLVAHHLRRGNGRGHARAGADLSVTELVESARVQPRRLHHLLRGTEATRWKEELHQDRSGKRLVQPDPLVRPDAGVFRPKIQAG